MDEEKLLKIINHYGLEAQLKYIHTEYFELDEAIMTMDKVEFSNKHIAEELADVMVMLKQIQLYFLISDEEIDKIADYKIERQLERIEKEKANVTNAEKYLKEGVDILDFACEIEKANQLGEIDESICTTTCRWLNKGGGKDD